MITKFNCPECGNRVLSEDLSEGESTQCPHCGVKITITDDIRQTNSEPTASENVKDSVPGRKYFTVARFVAWLIRALALALLITRLVRFWIVDRNSAMDVMSEGIILSAEIILQYAIYYAFAEFILIVIRIEENTRASRSIGTRRQN